MGAVVTGGWWRRNAAALIALAVLVPASWFAFDTLQFGIVRNATQDVGAYKTVEVEGALFGVARMSPLDVETVSAPAGTQPVLVVIPVYQRDGSPYCLGVTVTEPATGRTWRSASGVLDWSPAQGQYESCLSESDARFQLVAPVLLADDAVGPYIVEVSVSREHDVLDLRFAVDG